jgi:hypothetical protein
VKIRTKRVLHAIASTSSTLVLSVLLAYAHAGDLICIQVRTLIFVLILGIAASAGWGILLGGRWNGADQ